MARDLEAALRRRGDSEPQTPVMAHRSLLSRADTAAELTSSLDLPARNTQVSALHHPSIDLCMYYTCKWNEHEIEVRNVCCVVSQWVVFLAYGLFQVHVLIDDREHYK